MHLWPLTSWVFWLLIIFSVALFLCFGRGPQASRRGRLRRSIILLRWLPPIAFAIFWRPATSIDAIDLALEVTSAVLVVFAVALLCWALFSDPSRGRKRCPKCWYDMHGAPTLTCPECGRTARSERKLFKARRRWRLAALSLPLALLAAASAVAPRVRDNTWPEHLPDLVVIALVPFDLNKSYLARKIEHRIRTDDPYSGWLHQRVAHWAACRALSMTNDPHIASRGLLLVWDSQIDTPTVRARMLQLAETSPASRVTRDALYWLAANAADDDRCWQVIEAAFDDETRDDLDKLLLYLFDADRGSRPALPVPRRLLALSHHHRDIVRHYATANICDYQMDYAVHDWIERALADCSLSVRVSAASMLFRKGDYDDRVIAVLVEALRYEETDLFDLPLREIAGSSCSSSRLWRAMPAAIARDPVSQVSFRFLDTIASTPGEFRVDTLLALVQHRVHLIYLAQALQKVPEFQSRHITRMRLIAADWRKRGLYQAADELDRAIIRAESMTAPLPSDAALSK